MRPTTLALVRCLAFAPLLSSCRATSPLSPCAQGSWRGSAGITVTFQLTANPTCQDSQTNVQLSGTGTFEMGPPVALLIAGTQVDSALFITYVSSDSSLIGSFRGVFVRPDSASGILTWAQRPLGTLGYVIANGPFGLARQ